MNEGSFFQDLAVLTAVVGGISIIFTRFRWPKVIGYLLAGILMSEHTWGGSFLADSKTIGTVGQLGIVFLMFTLGLEFSAGGMRKVRHVALPTALFDTVAMIWLGYVAGRELLGWGAVQSLFLGAAICDSATTLLAKTVEEMKWGARPFVRYVFGTTIVEDILCVGVIALITGVAKGKGMSAAAVGTSLGGLALFFTGVVVFGMLVVPRTLNRVGKMRDSEALLLTTLGFCFLVSFLAFKLDYSLALGAFLVGMLGASSEVRQKLHELAAPLRNMFAAVFFVTIGLLVDPAECLRNWAAIVGLAALIIVGKGFNCFLMSLLTGQGVKDAVQTGMGMAQIGEFAYMVALTYMTLTGDTGNPMYQIVVGASLLTTLLNPAMLKWSDRAGDWAERRTPAAARGWLAAYRGWLKRFREARMPSRLVRHMRVRLAWLGVLGALNLCVGAGAAMLARLDYSNFSATFDAHKNMVWCVAANVIFISLLWPMTSLARSVARDAAMALAGSGRHLAAWKRAVRQVTEWFVAAAAALLAFAEIVMLNVSLQPETAAERWMVRGALLAVAVFGWKKFGKMARTAGYTFNRALAAERRAGDRARAEKPELSAPGDYVARVEVGAGAAAAGKTIRELDIRARTGASVVSVTRGGKKVRNPDAQWRFAAGDLAAAIGEPEQIAALREMFAEKAEGGGR